MCVCVCVCVCVYMCVCVLQLGFVNVVVADPAKVNHTAMTLANRITVNAPLAVRQVRAVAWRGLVWYGRSLWMIAGG